MKHANTTCVTPKRRVSRKTNPSGKATSAPARSSMTASASLPEPASVAQTFERRRDKTLAIGRIEKGKTETRALGCGAELPRVAPKDAGRAAKIERREVGADDRRALRALVHQQSERRAARQRLDRHGAGAGEKVDDTGAGEGVAIGMHENIENCLAQAVRGRPDRVRNLGFSTPGLSTCRRQCAWCITICREGALLGVRRALWARPR